MIKSSAQNISTKFRDSFEKYEPNSGGLWREISKATGDIIQVDGNAASASYLVISKDPLVDGQETIIESISTFDMPMEMSFGLHMSQRTLGQEFFVEIVDTDEAMSTQADIDIANIQQTTTTITVNTPTPHGLVPGKRIGIKNVPDSRFNYPSLVVASIPSPTQFTATAGPGGTIASVTAGPYSTAGMKVYYRPAFNYSKNGVNYVFENTTATNATLYVRGSSGDTLPSGTILGNQSGTVWSTSSVQLVGSVANTYAFTATTEFRLAIQGDRIQWHSSGIDSTAETTNHLVRTQVIPDVSKTYKLRLRFRNSDSFPVVDAQIVSIVKTSATTSRVTLDRNINTVMTAGLTQINLYGVRDRTANVYPNITTPVTVTAIPANNQIDITHGTVSGTVSYGGFISIANGGTIIPGVSPQTIQSVSITNGILTFVGDATWTGMLIGDYLNAVGVRNIVDGSSLNLDGTYRVRNINTTALELEPIGATVTWFPTTLGSTNCGGGIIKRTDARMSFIRVFDYERERVEVLARPSGDAAGGVPMSIKSAPTLTVNANSSTAVDSAMPNPLAMGGRASNANIAAMSATWDLVAQLMTMIGVSIFKPYSLPEADWTNSLTLTTNTDTALQAAWGAGIKKYLTALQLQNTNAVATTLIVKDGTTAKWTVSLPASMTLPIDFVFPTPIQTTANTALNVACGTTGANVIVNGQGYTAP